MINVNLTKYLDKLGKQVMNRAKAGLQKAGKQGNLENSINFSVNKTDDGYEVFWTMNYYGAFLDKGVSGAKVKRSFTNYQGQTLSSPGKGFTSVGPPIDIISKWIKSKGIKGHGVKKGRSKKTGQFVSGLAYLISRKIKQEGIPSIMFFQKPLGLAMKTFDTEVEVALARDLEATIKGTNIKFN